MYFFALDTSAISKRYHIENGTPFVMKLFALIFDEEPARLIISRMIVAETLSVLKR